MSMDNSIQAQQNAITDQLIYLHESNLIPDMLLKESIRSSLSAWLRDGYKPSFEEQLSELVNFAHSMESMPIAVQTDKPNSQMYELPAEFFELFLGKHMKYSCNYFLSDTNNIDEAEKAMLELYCERAQVKDGQAILDLGCGWGSLCIYIAEKYSNCKIKGICNSKTQKAYIDKICRERKLQNVKIIVSDISIYEMEATFDRIFSIEMLEYIKNYKELLKKISKWMKEDSLLFVQHWCHKVFSHQFQEINENMNTALLESRGREWAGRYFLTGVTLASTNTLLYFQEHVCTIDHWVVNGNHWSRTSEEWLKRMDEKYDVIQPIMRKIYGEDSTVKWISYWRSLWLFMIELFGYNNGEEWMVTQMLFKKK